MTHSAQWVALVGYAALVFVAAPRTQHHRGFLWARSREGASGRVAPGSSAAGAEGGARRSRAGARRAARPCRAPAA